MGFLKKRFFEASFYATIVKSIYDQEKNILRKTPKCIGNKIACACLSIEYCIFLGKLYSKIGILEDNIAVNYQKKFPEELVCELSKTKDISYVSYNNCINYFKNNLSQRSKTMNLVGDFLTAFSAFLEKEYIGNFTTKKNILKCFLDFMNKEAFFKKRRMYSFTKEIDKIFQDSQEQCKNQNETLFMLQKVVQNEMSAILAKKENIKHKRRNINYYKFLNTLNSILCSYFQMNTKKKLEETPYKFLLVFFEKN